MSDKMMRSLSVGAILYVLLIVAVIFCGPLNNSAVAKPGIVIGFVVGENSLVKSSEQGLRISEYLHEHLSIPVKMRSFAAEDQLYNWLILYREVDIAWLSSDFLQRTPSGQLYALARNHDYGPGLHQGEVVARQGVNEAIRRQVSEVLLSMGEIDSGKDILAQLGISQFVAPQLWQTSAWGGVSQQPPAAVEEKVEPDWKTSAWQEESQSPEKEEDALVAAKEPEIIVAQETQQASPITIQSSDEPHSVEEPEAEKPEQPQAAAAVVIPIQSQEASIPETEQPEPDAEAVLAVPSAEEVAVETASETLPEDTPAKVEPEELKVQQLLPESPKDGLVDASVESADPDQQIELVADYLAYNADEESYEAKGNVVLRRAGVELQAEELLWQAATQDASASGAINLQDSGTKVSGEQLQYNMATGQGQVQQGQVFISEGGFRLAGDEIEKHGHADYFVKNGSFTTCEGEIPDWKFSAEEVDVTLGGYATAKNVFFHIKDVPVLYTPYLFFPVKTERESGLLTPWFGYSDNKGVRASMAWYQVIDRNMDATFYLDYMSEIAVGKGLEFRYALANQNNGEALYYHASGVNGVSDMYYLEWQHRGLLPQDWTLTADVEYADKQRIFDEFGEVAEDYNRDKVESTLMLQKNWQKLNLVAYGRYLKDLENEDYDGELQRLPELGLSLPGYRLGETPLYLGLESYATRFWREEGEDGERVYLKPSLSASFMPGSWLEIVPTVALLGNLYDTNESREEKLVPEFNLTLATRLQKSFAFNAWGIERMQHSIEPKVIYTYIPDEGQDELPEFDHLDRIDDRNEVEYAIVNRLISRSTGVDGTNEYREFLNLRLSQSYDIDEKRNNPSGKDQPFSDVRAELNFEPARNMSVEAESLVPVYGPTTFRSVRVEAAAYDLKGNAAELEYNYRDEEFDEIATDYIRFRLDTSLFKPVYLRFEERYDFRESRELERRVGIEYRSKCWSLLLTYKNRHEEDDDDDHEVMVNFVLAGLGQNKGFGDGFGSVVDR